MVCQQPVTTERDLWETTHTARINLDYTVTPTMLLHLGGGYMGFSFFDPVPNFQGYDALANLGLPGTYSKIPPTIIGLQGTDGSGMGTNPMMGTAMGPNAQQHQWSEKPTGTGDSQLGQGQPHLQVWRRIPRGVLSVDSHHPEQRLVQFQRCRRQRFRTLMSQTTAAAI